MNSRNFFQHALQSARWQPQRQALALLTVSLFVAIIIGALYLSQAAGMATMGRQLETLIEERTNLEQANEQLRAEISSLQSIGRLQVRAQELGFLPAQPNDLDYMVMPGYNPVRQPVVAPREDDTAEPVLPEYDESLLGWLQEQIDAFAAQLEQFSAQEG
jgi:cell division protein FtsB